MSKILNIIIVAVLTSGSAQSWGATPFYATVNDVIIYGSGMLAITFNSAPINEPGCIQGDARIDIHASHPRLKEYYAMALAAKAMGAKIYGVANGCAADTGRATLDQSYNSFMYIDE